MRSIRESVSGITSKMVEWFNERTNAHISRVQEGLYKLADLYDWHELYDRAKDHDRSKFSSEEMDGYIWSTEKYRCQRVGDEFECIDGAQELMDTAWDNHQKVNRHHPEYHASLGDMENEDIAEMVADWVAMGKELGNTAKEWADKMVGDRWKFSPEAVRLIYQFIDDLEGGE